VKRLALTALAMSLMAPGQASAQPDGQYLYVLTCSGCHGATGAASREGRIPALADSIGHYMKTEEARRFLPQAPGIMMSGLSDAQVTALVNWMVPALSGPSLAGNFKPYTVEEIRASREAKPADFFAARRAVAAQLKAIGAQVAPY
jgi:mono/diheme cytochrome c family protein